MHNHNIDFYDIKSMDFTIPRIIYFVQYTAEAEALRITDF